jgi:hypothetical protein
MSSPKQRNRARRRAEKLMDTAVQAVLDEQLEKAARNSRQAIGLGRVNPRLWLDHGRVMRACGRLDEANEALRWPRPTPRRSPSWPACRRAWAS